MPLPPIHGKNLVAPGIGPGRVLFPASALTLPQSARKVPAMAKRDEKGPRLSARGREELAARQARQARALRENLRKRAAQRHGRTEPDPVSPPVAGDCGPEGKA